MSSPIPRSLDPESRRARAIVLLAATVLAIAAQSSGLLAFADRALEGARFAALTRPASGRIALVEMDARSVAAIARYPWPRVNYAAVVDRLRAAGAASVTFDVDLSSRSTARDDAAFAAALARADGLVALPTFGQAAHTSDRRSIDAMPIPELRPHVALASVSISPDRDGLVRDAPFGTMTYGVPHPSLSSWIANRSGTADAAFPIDYAIAPSTIPTLSFVDVRDGRFDPAVVRGHNVLIGATAIEMGDRYAVPRWSNLPGVVIQALAAETLLREVPTRGDATAPILFSVLLALFVVGRHRPRGVAAAGIGSSAMIVAAVLAVQSAGLVLPLAAPLLLVVAVVVGRFGLEVLARERRQRAVDPYTGLPNRYALLVNVADAPPSMLVALVANYDSLAAVLLASGEHQLILRLAERLGIAAGGGTVHRIADRLLAVALADGEDAAVLVERLRGVLLDPVEVGGRRVDAAISIGVDGAEETLAQRLATATLAAEDAGRRGGFWRPGRVDLATVERHVTLMGDLDQALRDGEIEVHYQPKLALPERRITGAEALVRWRKPSGAMIPPSLFVPLAEQTDRIGPLTLHVLRQVIADLTDWLADGRDLRIAINISARLLGDPEFDRRVSALLAGSPVSPERLIFEVTESAAFDDAEIAAASLRRLRSLGVSLSMDDYGTGQSTLSYLRELPLSELKIDRCFVEHVAVDRKDEAMVRSTIDLAHELGLKVVAEGIEDEACLVRLEELGCDTAQGFHVSRPVPRVAFEALVEAGAERRAG